MAYRYFLELAFEGTHYHGWQRQTNALSVQEVVETGLSVLLREPITVIGAGRTDAGVHATQLFAHFNSPIELQPDFLVRLNGWLPSAIACFGLYAPIPPDLHARFSAIRRGYHYHLTFRKDPIRQRHALWVRQPLDLSPMREACEIFRAHTDFASFCKAGSDITTTLCTIMDARIEVHETGWTYYVAANRFLRGMVRTMMGTLLAVGSGKLTPTDVNRLLMAQDRTQAPHSVSAQGLFLTEVHYPPGSLHPIAQPGAWAYPL